MKMGSKNFSEKVIDKKQKEKRAKSKKLNNRIGRRKAKESIEFEPLENKNFINKRNLVVMERGKTPRKRKFIKKNTKNYQYDAMLIPYSTVVGELVANIRHVERHCLHRINLIIKPTNF
jgi:hypothetical protein